MCNALMQIKAPKTNVREDIIFYPRSQNIVLPIGWIPQLASRIARSTGTAKVIAASDIENNLFLFKYPLRDVMRKQTTEQIFDSQSGFRLRSTQK